MRILITGASSFTGSHFVGALAAAGHHITASFRGSADSYTGLRRQRIDYVAQRADCVWNTGFGDDRFLALIGGERFDVLCHHGAEVTDYRSWDYDPLAASAANTRNARAVLRQLADRGGHTLVSTGSVFEPFEGSGDPQRRAFNPYGLAKHISHEVLRMEAHHVGLGLAKFVIPNPFGPFEDMRFTSYLAREWAAGRTPCVQTPDYLRDNIPVSLLALAYAALIARLPAPGSGLHAAPAGYVESQGAFARRLAAAIAPRTGWACALDLAHQSAFPEPLIRINPESAALAHPEWDETAAWDALAAYYRMITAG